MNIGLIGYGKMGQTIEKIALNKGHKISFILDTVKKKNSFSSLNDFELSSTDVVIEFTQPEAVVDNLLKCARAGLSVVTGTTGWYDQIKAVKDEIGSKIGTVYGSNFSVGVNLVFNLLRTFSPEISKPKIYDVACIETHHKWKKDSPSGTAKEICKIINDQFLPQNSEVVCSSVRMGTVIGKHEIVFDSEFDDITITHDAKNRDGFALGAVLSAAWISNKKGFFNFRDEFNNIMNFTG